MSDPTPPAAPPPAPRVSRWTKLGIAAASLLGVYMLGRSHGHAKGEREGRRIGAESAGHFSRLSSLDEDEE